MDFALFTQKFSIELKETDEAIYYRDNTTESDIVNKIYFIILVGFMDYDI